MVVQIMDESGESAISNRNNITGSNGVEPTPVQLDHCYAKPWNWRQEMAHCKPVRTLFAEENSLTSDELVDVEELSPISKSHPITNQEVTERNFIESEHKLGSLLTDENSVDWEETVKRDGWTPLQHRVFNKVVKLLVADNMARLATDKLENEAIQKKIHLEGSSKKLRIILSSVAWDVKITQWLHLTLIEHLNRDYLLCYISILQVLRSKVPTLVDRILNTPLSNSKLSYLNNQIVNYVVNKPWEPALSCNAPGIKKLPVTPFIIMVPSGTTNYNTSSSLSGSRRFQTWHNLLQTLGRVMTISMHAVSAPHSLPLPVFVETIISSTVQRIQDLKAGCPGRPIILVGLQQGALLAAQAAYLEQVTALVCLGFPLFCVDGKRGEPDDFLLDIRSPTLFAVGKSSSTCTVDGMEQLRHRMKAESSLLVVDGAMDSLRMLKWKKKQQNLTQSMVDACILEEVSNFFATVLSQTHGIASGKKSPVERKPDIVQAAGPVKRPRHSNDSEDSPAHPALSGHNYSQSTPFAQPWKGRGGGTGLARVRGGRVGPTHSRIPYQRTTSELAQTSRGRIGRSMSTGNHRLLIASGEHAPGRSPLRGLVTVRSSPSHLDGETDSKSSVCSSQGSPKEDGSLPPQMEGKGGGDSSETESAPPADDEDDGILEDLRFCNEFMNKQHQQQHNNHSAVDKSAGEDDFGIKFSVGEADLPLADVCRRLSAENRNRTLKNPASE